MESTDGHVAGRELGADQGVIPIDTFAARLVIARMHAGRLTQRQAAERCGLNYASWSNWENGTKVRDYIDAVRKIAEGLGVDERWLAFGGPLTSPRQLRRGSIPSKARLTKTARYGAVRTIIPSPIRPEPKISLSIGRAERIPA